MRVSRAVAALALAGFVFVLPIADASQESPLPPLQYGGDVTIPSDECPTCVGAEAHAGIGSPPNCADCMTLGAGASVDNDADGTTVTAQVCRGGFFYICIVDEEITI